MTTTLSVSVNFCSLLDFRLPDSSAFWRSFCTADISSSFWTRNVSSWSCVQSRFSSRRYSTVGNPHSYLTLGSHVCDCSALSSSLPCSLPPLLASQRAASTTSSG